MQGILVASDLSERSEQALVRAIRIAETIGADLTVLTIVDDAAPEDVRQPLVDRARAALQTRIDAASTALRPQIEVRVGDPTEDILTAIVQTSADLLVLGTHRTRAYFDGFRETTAQRIVRNAGLPVLVVRDVPKGPYRSILSLVDFAPASLAALQVAARIGPEATIQPAHAVHVPYRGMMGPVEGTRSALDASFVNDARAEDSALRDAVVLPDGCRATEIRACSAHELVADMMAKEPFDLITVGAHGRVGAGRALLGSFANELLREPPCDILVGRA